MLEVGTRVRANVNGIEYYKEDFDLTGREGYISYVNPPDYTYPYRVKFEGIDAVEPQGILMLPSELEVLNA